ncbi:unnamed protein product [Zymoseptoria tritici ST99CH_1A5]|nr:unnamed protein product [Zymoseptoria tritici ST99CH_3D7]SMR55200.1 unnamed protein product [Zymoseptoria tritici ST99CH_1E4]SMR57575.1 unnamed protein product [Zymoseptoria tritici ST99CH_3D1]SMY26011.1 unnamed protein product [Zymoseptoria tritici ST99CH_1A5]
MRVDAISTFLSALSGVSAVCVLPIGARYFAHPDPKFNKALLLSSNYPPAKFGPYKEHACEREPGGSGILHWRCAYGDKIKSEICSNDFWVTLSNEFLHNSGQPCHVDTTDGVNHGVWICVLE